MGKKSVLFCLNGKSAVEDAYREKSHVKCDLDNKLKCELSLFDIIISLKKMQILANIEFHTQRSFQIFSNVIETFQDLLL